MTLYDITVPGSTHLDALYFLRDSTDAEQYLETFFHELDPKFFTNCDFKVAKILSNDMLSAYLMQEIELLNDNGMRAGSFNFPTTKKRGKEAKLNYKNRSMLGIVPEHLAMFLSLNFTITSKMYSISSWIRTFHVLLAI